MSGEGLTPEQVEALSAQLQCIKVQVEASSTQLQRVKIKVEALRETLQQMADRWHVRALTAEPWAGDEAAVWAACADEIEALL